MSVYPRIEFPRARSRDTRKKRGGASSAGYSRESVLIICAILLLGLFSITAFVTRLYHNKIQALADQWFSDGENNFRAQNVKPALVDYRNALAYSPNNPTYQFHLAIALAAAGFGDQARSYLTNLLAESPGSGEINLELARIAARQDDLTDALLYYHSAIYGVWDKDPLAMRWNVRRELCEYLLNRRDVQDPQPDIIALAQEVPMGDIQRQKEVAALLLRTGLSARTLDEFRLILKADPRDQEALAGAGTASFELGRYPQATAYFSRLSREKLSESTIASMFETSRQVESASPFLERLSAAEKAKRTTDALRQAQQRGSNCARQHDQASSAVAPNSQLQILVTTSQQQMAKDWSEAALQRNTERVEPAMSLAFEMEEAATQECGAPPAGPDQILVLIARSREAANP